MKILLQILFFCSFTGHLLAQVANDSTVVSPVVIDWGDEDESESSYIQLSYGQSVYFKDFHSTLNTPDNYTFGKPIQYIGLEAGTTMLLGRNFYNHTSFGANFYIGQDVHFNDTVSGALQGFNVYYNLIGYDVFQKSSVFDLVLAGGVHIGQMKAILDDYRARKNPFFGLQASLSPSFTIKSVVRIGLRLNVFWDMTKGNWNKTLFRNSGETYQGLNKLNQSSFGASFFVGYSL